jgi:hypothetical protein
MNDIVRRHGFAVPYFVYKPFEKDHSGIVAAKIVVETDELRPSILLYELNGILRRPENDVVFGWISDIVNK